MDLDEWRTHEQLAAAGCMRAGDSHSSYKRKQEHAQRCRKGTKDFLASKASTPFHSAGRIAKRSLVHTEQGVAGLLPGDLAAALRPANHRRGRTPGEINIQGRSILRPDSPGPAWPA